MSSKSLRKMLATASVITLTGGMAFAPQREIIRLA